MCACSRALLPGKGSCKPTSFHPSLTMWIFNDKNLVKRFAQLCRSFQGTRDTAVGKAGSQHRPQTSWSNLAATACAGRSRTNYFSTSSISVWRCWGETEHHSPLQLSISLTPVAGQLLLLPCFSPENRQQSKPTV